MPGEWQGLVRGRGEGGAGRGRGVNVTFPEGET